MRKTVLFFVSTLFWLIALTGIAYRLIDKPLVGVDDANIFFVYARNLLNGEGFVYNPGGEPVEGFTSLAWVLLSTLSFWLSPHGEIILLGLTVLFTTTALTGVGLYLMALLHRYSSEVGTEKGNYRWVFWIFLAWAFASPGYIIWMTLALMENALWSMLLLLGVVVVGGYSCDKYENRIRLPILSFILVLLLLSRPEGMFWAPALIGFAYLSAKTNPIYDHAWRKIPGILLGVFGIALGFLTAFRLMYFGYPLPNTFYAKVSPDILYNLSQGLNYLYRFLSANILITLIITIDLVIFLSFIRRILQTGLSQSKISNFFRNQGFLFNLGMISSVILAGLTLPVLTGGDHFHLFRFYQPLWPLLIIPSLLWIAHSTPGDLLRNNRYGAVVAIALGLAIFYASQAPAWHQIPSYGGIIREFTVAEVGRDWGEAANNVFDHPTLPYPSIGISVAGGFALEYHGTVVDLLGLNNTAMAHAAGDRRGLKNHSGFNPSVFDSQAPDLLIESVVYHPATQPRVRADRESFLNRMLQGYLYADAFTTRYIPAILVFQRAQEATIELSGYFRADYLRTLKAHQYTIETVAISDR